VVLTGMLDDGTAGLLAIKDRAGTAIVQDPEEAEAPSMPRSALQRVPVDHCLKLRAMPALLLELARDDPSDTAPQEATLRLMEIENRIASGVFSAEDWAAIERVSAPSGLNCPDCRSALQELRDPRVLRFRCRAGHAYSARSLASAQTAAWETELSTLFGLAMEEATLARRMLAMDGHEDEPGLAARLRGRIETLEREAAQVAGWLHASPGA
jgi:two-component system, chemotaxis family, protein-glutamate methylesterase/glutaminase